LGVVVQVSACFEEDYDCVFQLPPMPPVEVPVEDQLMLLEPYWNLTSFVITSFYFLIPRPLALVRALEKEYVDQEIRKQGYLYPIHQTYHQHFWLVRLVDGHNYGVVLARE
jgi:hypothetical protein